MHGKLEKCRNLNLINSRRPSFGDQVNVTFMLQPVQWILNSFYILHILSSKTNLKEFHIWHRQLTV